MEEAEQKRRGIRLTRPAARSAYRSEAFLYDGMKYKAIPRRSLLTPGDACYVATNFHGLPIGAPAFTGGCLLRRSALFHPRPAQSIGGQYDHLDGDGNEHPEVHLGVAGPLGDAAGEE